MTSVNISIAGFGLVNPVGVGADACAAAVRAGINQYADSNLASSKGEPYKMATVPDACLPEIELSAAANVNIITKQHCSPHQQLQGAKRHVCGATPCGRDTRSKRVADALQ